MQKIPDDVRERVAADPFMTKCCITGITSEKIDWHHNLIYAGRQVNEDWAILPLARSVHDNIVQHKEKCDWIMLNRATDDQLRPYCKAINYIRRREILNTKYGTYTA